MTTSRSSEALTMRCGNCGAPLQPAVEVEQVQCHHCGAQQRVDAEWQARMVAYSEDAHELMRHEVLSRRLAVLQHQAASASRSLVLGAVGSAGP